MLDMTREVTAIISAAAGVLGVAVPFVITFLRKARQFIKEQNWNKIMEILPKLIIEAEKFVNYDGHEKKEFVKSRLAVYSNKNKIMFDEEKFDNTIDDIVKLTKEVNKRDKDTQNILAVTKYN